MLLELVEACEGGAGFGMPGRPKPLFELRERHDPVGDSWERALLVLRPRDQADGHVVGAGRLLLDELVGQRVVLRVWCVWKCL